jgi:hypothetical protein
VSDDRPVIGRLFCGECPANNRRTMGRIVLDPDRGPCFVARVRYKGPPGPPHGAPIAVHDSYDVTIADLPAFELVTGPSTGRQIALGGWGNDRSMFNVACKTHSFVAITSDMLRQMVAEHEADPKRQPVIRILQHPAHR